VGKGAEGLNSDDGKESLALCLLCDLYALLLAPPCSLTVTFLLTTYPPTNFLPPHCSPPCPPACLPACPLCVSCLPLSVPSPSLPHPVPATSLQPLHLSCPSLLTSPYLLSCCLTATFPPRHPLPCQPLYLPPFNPSFCNSSSISPILEENVFQTALMVNILCIRILWGRASSTPG
jgi:hypothetical protein